MRSVRSRNFMTATDNSIAELAGRGRQTVARIRSALDSGRSASIAHIVELIREVTCKFDTISVQGLGEVIGRDLLTVSRVISVAHTLGYNPEGVEISTINQAIHVIGFNKIRNLALSLMLVHNASTEMAAEKRDVAAFALLSGLIAQSVRERQRPDDAEEAFVCAALRSYGRIMLANFMPDEYRQAVSRARDGNEAAAFRAIFGLSPLELSIALLEQTRMPRNVMIGLREVLAGERSSGNLPSEFELPVVADFAEELCRLTDEPRLDADQFAARAMRLIHNYGSNIGLSEDELFELLEEVSGTLNLFGALRDGNPLNCGLFQRLRAFAHRADPPASGAKPRTTETDGVAGVATINGQTTRHYRDPLAAGIAALMEMETLRTVAVEPAHATALKAIHAAFDLGQTIAFRRNGNEPIYRAWMGAGDFFEVIKGEELLDANRRDVFSVCLKRSEDVLIQNPADPKIQPFVPEWLAPAAGNNPMILLPVRDDHGTVTVFCGLRNEAADFLVTARQTQQLRALRQRLAQIERQAKAAGGIVDETKVA